jgi:hypothetical protein
MATIENSVGKTESMVPLLLQYTYLQLLDFLTTVAFLLHGVKEGNPFVRFFLETLPNPLVGLLVVKAAAVILAVFCVRTARRKLLGRINFLFAVVVAWNLVALIIGSAMVR